VRVIDGERRDLERLDVEVGRALDAEAHHRVDRIALGDQRGRGERELVDGHAAPHPHRLDVTGRDLLRRQEIVAGRFGFDSSVTSSCYRASPRPNASPRSSYDRMRAAGSNACVAIITSSALVRVATSSIRARHCSGVPTITRRL
jgi:hypothetical protein